MAVSTISPRQLHDAAQRGERIELIDVRTPVEFQEVHVEFARNVPLDELDAGKLAAGRPADQPLYVICRSGSRGRQAAEKLQSAGLSNVLNVDGGTQAWDAAGFPVNRDRKVVSLERQVRIAAGLLVLTGAILSWFAHPAWVALSAFVGTGLVFAGITDTCGMGMLLAKMPWNRVCSGSSASGSAGASCAAQ